MNTSTPISILMPVHNGARFLVETLQSLLAQTFTDFELLIIDDGSTDESVAIIGQTAGHDRRLRLETGRGRLGFSGALNLGLDLARGAFIARMDADDLAAPDRLAVQYSYLQAHPEVGLIGGRVRTFGLREELFHRPPLSYDETRCYALFDNPFAHPTVMLRRDLMEQYQLRYDPSYCPADDYELWARALRLFPCVNIDRVVLRYRVHAHSMSEADWGEMDRLAARIAARELAELGLPTDDETIRFHRNLGRGRCFPIRHREELIRGEQWLHTLLAAAGRSGRYPVEAFRHTVADIWYRACYHAGALGPWMFRRYAGSPLRRARPTSGREWLALARLGILSK